jgi:rhamnogalacturonan hydrolase
MADFPRRPGLLKLVNVTNFSVHDLALVDAPASHFSIQTSTNGEVYNMVVKGANLTAIDGVNVGGKNIWVHDLELTNGGDWLVILSQFFNERTC